MSPHLTLARVSAATRARWRRELASFEALDNREKRWPERAGALVQELTCALDALDAADAVMIQARHALEDAARVLDQRDPDPDAVCAARAGAERAAGELALARLALGAS